MLDHSRLNIAIIGTGISGMSAAWLLDQGHNITIFEKNSFVGGHCNTVDARFGTGDQTTIIPVDTGFIVYNEQTYPNLTALFEHLDVATENSSMSFSASVNEGQFEYSGSGLGGLLAQRRNLVRPRFWNMVLDILRFYKQTTADAELLKNTDLTLGDYLAANGYSDAFLQDHILPMASSIWSASPDDMQSYPLAAFVRFFSNHGLLQRHKRYRPQWRTVTGGSREYVKKVTAPFTDRIRLNTSVRSIERTDHKVTLNTADGTREIYDHVVIAAHADQALAMLAEPSDDEKKLLGAIRYERNDAVLHTDDSLMPQRRRAWSSWNYISGSDSQHERLLCLTYWMNKLQNIDLKYPVFVTLNAYRPPNPKKVIASFTFEHPIFDRAALNAQKDLWQLQGNRRVWLCGSYFGHGFHEDGIQSGLAVAEALGGRRRPWSVQSESGRIFLPDLVEIAA